MEGSESEDLACKLKIDVKVNYSNSKKETKQESEYDSKLTKVVKDKQNKGCANAQAF